MTPILEVRDLSVSSEEQRLVDSVSFALWPGQVLCVLGASGSGKSLLAHAIVGTLPPSLSADGAVMLDGNELKLADRSRFWGRRLALLPQEPWTALDPTMRALGQVTEVHRFVHNVRWRDAAGKARDDLRCVDVSPAAETRFPHQLSGGMAQRVALAATLATSASVLIVDEPTKGLDSDCQRLVLNRLTALQKSGVAIIVITHDIGLARSLGGESLVMRDAEVVERGTTKQVLDTPTDAYTRALLAADTSRWSTRRGNETVATETALVTADRVALSYNGNRVLNETSLNIFSGERWAFLGPSGVGKTSFCDLLLGIRAPSAGRVVRRQGLRATAFQKLFQDPVAAFAPRVRLRLALDDLLRLHAIPWQRAYEFLERLKLDDSLLDRMPHEVSGGELQRIALIRTLLVEPQLLVADEPTSRLDPLTQQMVINLLSAELEAKQTALVLVTHDAHIARHMADKILDFYPAIA